MAESIAVEVVYAWPDQQVLLKLVVPVGTSAREAVERSALGADFPELDVRRCPLGIFGKALSAPDSRILEDGERVEVYRPLIADPKEIRKRRAASAVGARQSGRG
ncbi:RnfH family protein [Pseudomonas sp. RIT-PI-AD]|uniref:RnfH family protein n=1 Tax=Pseudomonas sp. RIT-PI-AD TaxID=3035294 RepID=UPI0021D8619B|nr:RnfH family protein [Pseudomonas sp. RIT-PI-AD]